MERALLWPALGRPPLWGYIEFSFSGKSDSHMEYELSLIVGVSGNMPHDELCESFGAITAALKRLS